MTNATNPSAKLVWLPSTALSRLSQLQGIYLEDHQFHTDENDDLIANTSSIWTRIHPQGEVIHLSNPEQLTQHIQQIRGLWFDKQKSTIRLIRGIGLDRQIVIETPEGQLEYESIDHLLETGLIYLFISQAKQTNDEELVTATDWFLHGVAKKIREIKDGIIATFIMNILAVGTAIYSMQVYDRVVPSESRSTLIVLTVGVFLAIGFELLMKILRAKLIDQTFKEVDLELSSVFFNKALGIRLDARPKNVGTFISEIRQFESIRGFMTATTLFVLADAPFTLFFIVVMAFIGGYLSLIPVVFLLIMLLLGNYMSQKLKETNQKIIEESNRKNGFLIEAMDGIESIKASSGETQILQNWQGMTQSQAQRELQLKEVTTSSQAYAASLQQVAYVCTVAMGALLIQKGELSMGGLIGCTILTGRILGPLTQIPQLLVQWGQIKVSLASLNNIMSLPRDRKSVV
jgi:ATP-binding cassette subfamily C protein LapB